MPGRALLRPSYYSAFVPSPERPTQGDAMRQAAGDGDQGLARRLVAAGHESDGVRAARRRRRLEHRRHGRKTPREVDDLAASKVRPGTGDDGASSDTSSAEAGRGILLPPCLSHGAVSVIGRRREMEDAVAIKRTFLSSPPTADAAVDGCGGGDEDFFAVYDGHGGSRVAEACRDRMHVVLAEELLRLRPSPTAAGACADARGMKDALTASFARVDGEVVGGAAAGADADVAEARSRTVGSTAVVAVVGRRRIVVANCGDSRAVLSRAGVAVPLSTDHKPDRPDELQRVEAAGGRVINWNGSRVLGVLSTSRSIGDYYLKPYVSAEPEVTAVERTEKDEFLVLASDGLWDVVSNEMACRVARSCLNGHLAAAFPESVSGRSATDAAALLTELAISRGSKDNISVVVVELRRLRSRAGSRRASAPAGSEIKL
ncbi:protein phosphatase 2C 51-like [Lolium rigidum]|uniref:protein phosphatase 2C 51-like n=1 Tax=Lolium rigidum TaxID=89674 RepID=UPI001F5CA46C|nr:protein phosphatase 2C 51-like [Lolium rigidum]